MPLILIKILNVKYDVYIMLLKLIEIIKNVVLLKSDRRDKYLFEN